LLNRANPKARASAAWAVFSAALLLSSTALAQTASGRIQGKVTDAATNAAVGDVVVTATSPALQGEQTVVSDATGEFEIPTLPPGTYLLHLEKEGYRPLNQPEITIRLDKTIKINLKLSPESLKAEEVVVVGKAPTVDIGSTQTGSTVTDDFLNNIPVASPNSAGGAVRSFESLQATAPGANEDLYGVGVGGATSPENNYVIDGVNVTDPGFGLLGTSLSIDFIKEVDVITGGYMPEYGRATGGVTNVVTKSGGNEYHGSFAVYVQPGALIAPEKTINRLGQAISAQSKVNLNANIGAEVGGYIIKDKLWFYVGLEPTVTEVDVKRNLNQVTYQPGCPVDAKGNQVASSSDPAFEHYDTQVSGCSPAVQGVGIDRSGFPIPATTTPIAGTEKVYHNSYFGYQYIAKLTYLLNQDQHFTASVFGNPQTTTGPGGGALAGTLSSRDTRTEANVNDYSLGWNGAFLDKHVLAEATLGWHHQYQNNTPTDPSQDRNPVVIYTKSHSVTEFEPDAAKYCGAEDTANAAAEQAYERAYSLYKAGVGPLPAPISAYPHCRVTSYTSGGPGFLDAQKVDRYSGRLALTNLFRAAGHHEVKYGIDYEFLRFQHDKHYTGGVAFREYATDFRDYRRYGYLKGPDDPVFQDGYQSLSKSTSIAGFVQDSYRVLDLITLNLGVRWENQQLFQADGTKVIGLPNNIMPRLGAIYDFTGTGRSKIYANYGVFYEAVPLDILDREFPGERQIYARRNKKCDPRDPNKAVGICQDPSSLKPADAVKDPTEPDQSWTATGGAFTPVDPNLKGQATSEVVLGTEYEIIPDARLGVSYTHRNLNKIIEDMSNDGANTYFVGNPGEGIALNFPKPQRDYDAGTLYFNKAFSHRWLVNASYTLSRLYGNYSGLFRPETGQLDPNITSDFDLTSLLANRTGALPGDHTHSVKLYAAYEIPIRATQSVSLGMSYSGLSGAPTNYLGAHPVYGSGEANILPRGAGERLPWIHEVDTSFKYNYRFSDSNVLTASADIFNILDLRQITQVDQNYTLDSVIPIVNGKTDDLKNLTTSDTHAPVLKNPNFGNASSYQAPLSVRFGLKVTF
jgi:hypothetical protein